MRWLGSRVATYDYVESVGDFDTLGDFIACCKSLIEGDTGFTNPWNYETKYRKPRKRDTKRVAYYWLSDQFDVSRHVVCG